MTASSQPCSRILGRYSSGRPGPTLLVCAGLHGNEPAGVRAAEEVCGLLAQSRPSLSGELLCLAGNLEALKRGVRYVDEDLNRAWAPRVIEAMRGREAARDSVEQREQRSLLEILDGLDDGGYALDLHTTSGPTAPFALMADTLANQRFVRHFPVPVVMGLEESVTGTLLSHLSNRDFRALVVESGQHDDIVAVDHHQAVIWIALVAAGLLRAQDVPALGGKRRQLRAATAGLPRVVELRYIHQAGPGFTLPEGWSGFRTVKKSEILAQEQNKSVRALLDGRILMPRYQAQGSDGFFMVQAVGRWKLALGRNLRRLHLDWFLPWVWPGVSRASSEPRALRVTQKRNRRALRAVMRAFGYRHRHRDGGEMVFSQRKG